MGNYELIVHKIWRLSEKFQKNQEAVNAKKIHEGKTGICVKRLEIR